MEKKSIILPEELLRSEVVEICSYYHIDFEQAYEILERTFMRYPKLIKKIAISYPGEDVTRLSEYKHAVKEAKKQIYYSLRQYHRDKDQETQIKNKMRNSVQANMPFEALQPVIQEILTTHVSTRERLPYFPEFYQQLFRHVHSLHSIIDIGCGIHPLSYPFTAEGNATELYIAIDKDPLVIEMLEIFAPSIKPTNLLPLCHDLLWLRSQEYLINGRASFDVAIMMKLIPVIARQDRALLHQLVTIPARQLVITASAQAMTRALDIARREDHVLQQFIKMTGRPVQAALTFGNEFGYVLGPMSETPCLKAASPTSPIILA
jgi:16S rRNA (guanine(1405)-N(7))-methyltransferase